MLFLEDRVIAYQVKLSAWILTVSKKEAVTVCKSSTYFQSFFRFLNDENDRRTPFCVLCTADRIRRITVEGNELVLCSDDCNVWKEKVERSLLEKKLFKVNQGISKVAKNNDEIRRGQKRIATDDQLSAEVS